MKLKKIALTTAASLLVLVGAVTFLPLRAIAGLETPCNYISDLVATNPLSSDLASTGDDHLRCIKSVLKTTFPNINAAVTATDENLNVLSASSTAAGILELEAAAPRLIVDETDASSNERLYDFASSAGQLLGRTRTDADAAGATWITVDRTGTTVDSIALAATTISTGGILSLTKVGTPSSQTLQMQSTRPMLQLNQSDAAANNGSWSLQAVAEAFIGSAYDDAGSSVANWLRVERNGTTVDSIDFTATALTLNGNPIVSSTSGTYTPTSSNTTNLDSITPATAQYFRVGSVMTISGEVTLDETTAGNATSFQLSLPISSAISATTQCGGGGAVEEQNNAVAALVIQANVANDTLQFDFRAQGQVSTDLHYTATCLIN